MTLAARDPRHGTTNGYGNHGCRCDACRQANTAYMKERGFGGYAKNKCACGNLKRVPARQCRECVDRERAADHGTESRYSSGCRCDECRTAASAAKRERRIKSRVPCSHGCGTMVDWINRRQSGKPPECGPCSIKRLRAEGRLGRTAAA